MSTPIGMVGGGGLACGAIALGSAWNTVGDGVGRGLGLRRCRWCGPDDDGDGVGATR